MNEILTWDGFGAAAGELAQQVADSGFAPTVLLAPALDATHLADQRVLVVDDVADTGETLRLVIDTVRPAVAELRTLAIYHKPRSVVRPDYVWRHTDRWIEFPWSSLPVVRPRGG